MMSLAARRKFKLGIVEAVVAGAAREAPVSCGCRIDARIANLQKMAVAERREAEPTTGRRNEVGLAVPQATIELLAQICRQ